MTTVNEAPIQGFIAFLERQRSLCKSFARWLDFWANYKDPTGIPRDKIEAEYLDNQFISNLLGEDEKIPLLKTQSLFSEVTQNLNHLTDFLAEWLTTGGNENKNTISFDDFSKSIQEGQFGILRYCFQNAAALSGFEQAQKAKDDFKKEYYTARLQEIFNSCYGNANSPDQSEIMHAIENGADFEENLYLGDQYYNSTVLIESIRYGFTDVVRRIVSEQPRTMRVFNASGELPIHVAFSRVDHGIVDILMEHGASLDDRDLLRPLIESVLWNPSLELFQLIEHNYSPDEAISQIRSSLNLSGARKDRILEGVNPANTRDGYHSNVIRDYVAVKNRHIGLQSILNYLLEKSRN